METHSVSKPANLRSWCLKRYLVSVLVQAGPLPSRAEAGENLTPQLCCTQTQRLGSEAEHSFCWVHTEASPDSFPHTSGTSLFLLHCLSSQSFQHPCHLGVRHTRLGG